MSTSAPQRRASGVSLRNISFTYVNPQTGARVHALDDVNLDVVAGEFLCILGPSGCGKSTMLSMVAGLIRPTTGEILVDGRHVTGPGADRGMVFQEYALLPWKTVLENVALGLKIRGVRQPQRDELAQSFINLVHLNDFEAKYPHELSGGMRQRVAVARTLANSPSIMLMDEPFAAVDAQTRASLQEELTRIWEEQRLTVIFVTHNVDEAIFLGDRVVVMSARPGRIRSSVAVDIPRQSRSWATLEREPRYFALKAELGELLRSQETDPAPPTPESTR